LAISCGLVKANWVDDIEDQIKAELSYIGNYPNTSDSVFATLSGTTDQQLATLREHHDQQLSIFRGNHDSQLGVMRQKHDQQLDALWKAGYQPTFIDAEQNRLLEQEHQLSTRQLQIEQQLINIQLEVEHRFIANPGSKESIGAATETVPTVERTPVETAPAVALPTTNVVSAITKNRWTADSLIISGTLTNKSTVAVLIKGVEAKGFDQNQKMVGEGSDFTIVHDDLAPGEVVNFKVALEDKTKQIKFVKVTPRVVQP